MSPKQPSKQKRAAQNRNQRAAREARKAAANTATGSRAASDGRGGGGGGFLSRLRGSGRASTGSTAASTGRRPSLAEARALQPPGYRAALSAVFAAVAAIVLCGFLLRYPVDGQGDLYTGETLVADWVASALDAAQAAPDLDAAELAESIEVWAPGRADKTVLTALWPWSIATVLPLIGAAITFWAVRRRSSSKVLNRALYATLFGAVLTQGLLLLFIPVVLAVGVAMFQVRKAEAQALAASQAGDDVIDVDSEEVDGTVEGDELDEEDVVPAGAGDVEVIDALVVERAEADATADPDRQP